MAGLWDKYRATHVWTEGVQGTYEVRVDDRVVYEAGDRRAAKAVADYLNSDPALAIVAYTFAGRGAGGAGSVRG